MTRLVTHVNPPVAPQGGLWNLRQPGSGWIDAGNGSPRIVGYANPGLWGVAPLGQRLWARAPRGAMSTVPGRSGASSAVPCPKGGLGPEPKVACTRVAWVCG
jgi:hypothetical protein